VIGRRSGIFYYCPWHYILNRFGDALDLVIHGIAADIEYLARYIFGRRFDHSDKSAHDIPDMYKRSPLQPIAIDIYFFITPGMQAHNIDRKVKTHAWRQPENGGSAEYYRFELRGLQ